MKLKEKRKKDNKTYDNHPVDNKKESLSAKEKFLAIPYETFPVSDYLDVLKTEYERDLTKWQSWQSRAGMIITVLSAICVFVLEKVKIADIRECIGQPFTSSLLLKFISGILVYIGFGVSFFYCIKTIAVKNHGVYNTDLIDESKLGKPRIQACIEIINDYHTCPIN